VLTPPGDARLAASLDLLKRQGLPPGEFEVLVAAHGPAIGLSRAVALSRAVSEAHAPRIWVMDVADRLPVNAASILLKRMNQEDLDLLAFSLRLAAPLRAERLRFDLSARLPQSPIMDGASMLSRHDFQPELACVVAAAHLWKAGALALPEGHDPVIDRAAMPQLVLRARRASYLRRRIVTRRRDTAGPSPDDAVATARSLRELVERLKAEGNPSANLALRLLRRAELVAIDCLRGLLLSGVPLAKRALVHERLRAAGALPIRHLGRPEATLRVRFWAWVVRVLG